VPRWAPVAGAWSGQLLTESLVLSLSGGVLGLLLAAGGIRILKLMNPGTIARLDEVSLNGGVLAFTLGISCFAGLIFGLVPALQAARPDLQHALKEGGRGSTGGGRRQLRGLLVTAEVALSLVLLAGAGLLIRSFLRLQGVDPASLRSTCSRCASKSGTTGRGI